MGSRFALSFGWDRRSAAERRGAGRFPPAALPRDARTFGEVPPGRQWRLPANPVGPERWDTGSPKRAGGLARLARPGCSSYAFLVPSAPLKLAALLVLLSACGSA